MPTNPEEPKSSPGGDARLRAAVAAWVATADEPEEPGGRAGDADADAAEPAGSDANTDTDTDTGVAVEPGVDEAAGSGANAGTDAGVGAEGGSASGRGNAGGDEPQAADAADEPDDEPADADATPVADVDADSGADSAADVAPDAEGAGDDVAGDSGSSEGDLAVAASATEGDSGGGPAAAADADEPQAADAAKEPVEPGEPIGSDGPDASAGAEPAAPVADAGDDRAAVDRGVAGGDEPSGADPDPTPEPEAEAKAEAEADEAPRGDSGAGTGSEGQPKAGSGSEPPEPRQDQHTAVFRTVRPGRPVDQPTTALKTVRPSAPVEPPESAAERTSTFVPLKPDAVRPAPVRKPEQKPQGAAPAAPPAPPARPVSAPAAPGRPAAFLPPAAAAPAAAQAIPEAERTRQQPMPPRPPLDMLAELTNKPAPPETPTRTAVRRVKVWTPLLLLVIVLFAVVQFLRPLPVPALALTADPSYTFKGGALDMPWPETGQSAVEVQGVGSIGTKGPQTSAPIASVAKVMTAYVILKEHPIKGEEVGPKITVDALAEKQSKSPDESTAAIKEGQQFTEKQMLQLLMIPSGNNAARLLARWDADSEDAFVKKMNDAAKDLGMKNTTYTDPSGFEKTTVSTATDQLELAKAVMEYDVFRGIVDLPEVEIPGIDGKIYNNNNILLNPGVSGIKTGSTTPAGGNLVWAADTIIDGKKRRIVGAVMGQQTDGTLDAKLQLAITNSLKLIQAAQRDVTSATVVKKGDVVGYIDDGLGGQTPVVATKDLKAVGWPGLKVELAISDGGKTPPHTAKAGTEIGQLTVGTGPGQVKAPVAVQKDLAEPAFGDKLTRIG